MLKTIDRKHLVRDMRKKLSNAEINLQAGKITLAEYSREMKEVASMAVKLNDSLEVSVK